MQFGNEGNYKTVLLMFKCVYESFGSCENANPGSVGVVSEKLQGMLILLVHRQTTLCALANLHI